MVASPSSASHGERDTLHFQLSPLLLVAVVCAVISTVAVVVAAVLANQMPPPPDGPHPPPPQQATPLIIAMGFFVSSWVTVAVAITRDQILHRLSVRGRVLDALAERLEQLSEQLTRDRSAALDHIDAQLAMLAQYGEQRETDGYLNGMRAAAAAGTNGEVRTLRTVPPPDR